MSDKIATIGNIVHHFAVTSKSFACSALDNIIAMSLYDPKPIEYVAGSNSRILVFIHGLHGHPINHRRIVDKLNASETTKDYVKVCVDLRAVTSDIEWECAELQKQIECFRDCEIILIGFSKGGLIAMYYATHVVDERIKGIITVSSPLNGTETANLIPAYFTINRELSSGSALTEKIKKLWLAKKHLIPLYHIVPTWDHLIMPTSVAKYDFTAPDKIYHYTGLQGHIGIQDEPVIADVIKKWIEEIYQSS